MRDTALFREVPLAEQRLQRRPDPPAIDAAQIAAEDRVVDLPRLAGIARQQLAVKLRGRAVLALHTPPWHGDGPCAVRRRDRPFDRPIAIAAAALGAFMSIRRKSHGELLGQRDVQRLSNVSAELGFDVLAELQNRAGACVSLLHGVPASPLLTAICLGQQEVTPFSFFHKTRDTSA